MEVAPKKARSPRKSGTELVAGAATAQPPVLMDGPASVLLLVQQAAKDPAVDIDKLERLMQMHERLLAQQAAQSFAADLAEMQQHLPTVGERGAVRNKSGAVQSTYALWEDINEAIKPILAQYGFALTFETDTSAGISVTGILTHRMGHDRRTSILLPADMSGAKNAVQAIASSISYGKRYTAGALLNLTSTNEDDDGNAGGGTPLDQGGTPQRQQPEPSFYPEESFQQNLPAWKQLILDGKRTADQVIAFVESRGIRLSDSQKNIIKNGA